MKRTNRLIAVVLFLISVAVGIGCSIIFEACLPKMQRWSSLYVMGRMDVFDQSQASDEEINSVYEWAISNENFVFLNGLSGAYYVDGGQWLSASNASEELVYITDNPVFSRVYLNGSFLILCPDIPVSEKRIESMDLPLFMTGSAYISPLRSASSLQGIIYSDGDIEGLYVLLMQCGYECLIISEGCEKSMQAVRQVFSESLVSSSVFLIILGLILCFCYSIHMLVKASEQYIRVHRMFGQTKGQVLFRVLLQGILVFLSSLFVCFVVSSYCMQMISPRQMSLLMLAVSGILFCLSCLVGLCCYLRSSRKGDGEK